jgi:hypothetical protein
MAAVLRFAGARLSTRRSTERQLGGDHRAYAHRRRPCAPRYGKSAVDLAAERDDGRQVAPIKAPAEIQ